MPARKLFSFLALFAVIILFSNCTGKSGKTTDSASAKTLSIAEVSINGMTCTGCEQKIKGEITRLEGVASVNASFTEGKAVVSFDPALTDSTSIRGAITTAGYTPLKFTLLPPSPSGTE
jgi:copper chaperone CopZ